MKTSAIKSVYKQAIVNISKFNVKQHTCTKIYINKPYNLKTIQTNLNDDIRVYTIDIYTEERICIALV